MSDENLQDVRAQGEVEGETPPEESTYELAPPDLGQGEVRDPDPDGNHTPPQPDEVLVIPEGAVPNCVLITNHDVDGLGFAIRWQDGPVGENGVNGAQNEDLIEVLIARLEGFQAGDFACTENGEALDHLRAALAALRMRTARRIDQGVEGTNARHESVG